MKKREIYPSVYAISITYGMRGFITIVVAFTDVEARGMAVDSFFSNNPDIDKTKLENPIQFMIAQLSAEEVAHQLTDLKFEEEPEQEVKKRMSKTDMMAKIITSKDRDLFEKNKKRFTKNERDFILDRLK